MAFGEEKDASEKFSTIKDVMRVGFIVKKLCTVHMWQTVSLWSCMTEQVAPPWRVEKKAGAVLQRYNCPVIKVDITTWLFRQMLTTGHIISGCSELIYSQIT